ncbi:MAG: cell wall hydrolase [Pseudomonadota bacterium]
MERMQAVRRAIEVTARWAARLAHWSVKATFRLGRFALTNPLVKSIGRLPPLRKLRRRLGPLARPVAALAAVLAATVAIAYLVRPSVYPGPQIAELAGDEQAACLALNIYHEARGEPDRGKLAVGHVVLNRVRDKRFPNEICAVIKDGGELPHNRCQFSWWCDGRSDKPADQIAWADSQAMAAKILSGAAKDPTGGALWYHADHVAPQWRERLVAGPQIGRHQFYLSN